MTMTMTITRRKPAIRRRSDLADKAADRAMLAAFAATIGAAKTSLRRDACGDWRLTGLAGHISTDDASLYASLACTSARAWTNVRRNLSFLTIHQDGDSEGVMRLDRSLTPTDAETLRTTLRIRKARAMGEAAMEALSAARHGARISLAMGPDNGPSMRFSDQGATSPLSAAPASARSP